MPVAHGFILHASMFQSEEIISLLTQGQKRARREAWIDNIGKVVFGLALPGQGKCKGNSK